MPTCQLHCYRCGRTAEVETWTSEDVRRIRRARVTVAQEHATCPYCGRLVADEGMSRRNSLRAYDAYRMARGLMMPAEIKACRTRYGLTQASFASLLGVSAPVLSRCENGHLQDDRLEEALRHAADPAGMLELLDQRRGELPPDQERTARAIVTRELREREGSQGTSQDGDANGPS